MNERTEHLKYLIENRLYVIEPDAVAGAILARSLTRHLVPETTFRNEPEAPDSEVRSFRPASGSVSFRLCTGRRRAGQVQPVHAR